MKNRPNTVRRLALLAVAALAFLTLPSCIHHRGHLHVPWLLPPILHAGYHYHGHHYSGHHHRSYSRSRSYRKSPRRATRRTSSSRPRRAVRR